MADKLISSLTIDNNLIEVYQNDLIYLSRAFPNFLRGFADHLDEGFITTGKPWFQIDCGIIYLIVNKKIVGYLAYGDEKNNVLYMIDSYLNKEFKNKDFFKILLNNLEILAKEKKCLVISVTLPVNEIEIKSAADELGLVEIYKQSVKRI